MKNPKAEQQKTPFRHAYGARLRTPITFPADSPYTDQSYGPESDINTIMARYQSTGELPVINRANAQYLDVSEHDFATHMQMITEAREMFAELPSKLRARFGNDPGAFLGFIDNPDNQKELAQLGLLTPEATQKLLYPNQTLYSE